MWVERDGFSGSISLILFGGLETTPPPLPPQFSTFFGGVVMPILLREAIMANLKDRAV